MSNTDEAVKLDDGVKKETDYAKKISNVLCALDWLERRGIKSTQVYIRKNGKPEITLLRPPPQILKGTDRIKIHATAYKRTGVFVAPVRGCIVTWTETAQ